MLIYKNYKLRKQIAEQWDIIVEQRKTIEKQRNEISQTEKLHRSLSKLIKCGKYKNQLFEKDGNYYIVMKCFDSVDRHKRKYSFVLHLYDITNAGRACRADVTVYYKEKKVELVNIDTYEQHRRLGLGSLLLQYIIHYCQVNVHDKLYAKMYEFSPITLDGVKAFYAKSGFELTDNNYAIMRFDTQDTPGVKPENN